MTPTSPQSPLNLAPQAPQEQYVPFQGRLVPMSYVQQLSPNERTFFMNEVQKEMAQARASQPQGENIMDNPWVSRGLFGGAMAGLTAATGGAALPIIGAGALGAAFPPQNGTEAATYAASEFMRPAFAAAQALKTPMQRVLASMGVGAGQEGVNAGIRAVGGQQPTSPSQMALSMLLPGATSMLATKAQPTLQRQATKVNIQKTVDQLTGQSTPVGPQMETMSGETPGVQSVLDDLRQKNANYENSQKALGLVSKQLEDTKSEQAKLLTQFMGPDNPADAAALSRKYTQLSKYVPSEYQPENQQLGKLQSAIDDTNRQLKTADMSPSDKDIAMTKIQALKTQQQQILQSITQKKADQLTQASMQQVGDQLTGNTKAIKDLQDIYDGLQKELTENPFQNPYLKTLLQSDPKNPTTLKTFVANLVNSDAENIKGLYEYLGNQPGVDAQTREANIKTIQGAFINEFINKAYDPKTKMLTNAPQLTATDGPFNFNKLQAIFGDGVEGRQNSQMFQQIVSDMRSLTESNTQPKAVGLGTIIGAHAFVGPTWWALHSLAHMPSMTAFGTAEAASLMVTSAPRFIQAAMDDPRLAKDIHDYAVGGGQGKLGAVASSWFNKNSSQY